MYATNAHTCYARQVSTGEVTVPCVSRNQGLQPGVRGAARGNDRLPTHTPAIRGRSALEGVTMPCVSSNQGLQPGVRGVCVHYKETTSSSTYFQEEIHTTMVGISHRL